jgi:MoxR-like ATPase
MNIQEVKELIAAADICGHVPLIKGVHGLGKSESAHQYARENNMHFEPLILSLMDTGDMLGLPVTREVNGVMSTQWAAPSWYINIVQAAWPAELDISKLEFTDKDFQEKALRVISNHKPVTTKVLNDYYCKYYNVPNDRLQLLRQNKVTYKDSKRSVLFLDEFNRAPADILNASLQLILDHRLHTHELPIVNGQETLVVAAVNPADGDYTVQEFDPALLDRFVDCEVTPDFKSWLTWAIQNNVNQMVIDFLVDNQSKFHFSPKDGSKGTSPRSWTRLATYIDNLDSTPKDIMPHYLKGTIGSSTAAQFIMFYNNYGSGLTIKLLEKMIKEQITKHKKTNPEEIAEAVKPAVEKLEAIRMIEFAETFVESYFAKTTTKNTLVPISYLYALPVECLASVLKSLQTSNPKAYANLALADKTHNNKKLFMKLVSHLKA